MAKKGLLEFAVDSPNSEGASGEAASSLPSPFPRFPIVGLGASAGGLDAIERFFSSVPIDGGMSYIVIQHLDPTHTSLLPELIQRVTVMNVVQVEDGTQVLPNSIYVIPPNKEISILHGVLRLFDFSTPHGFHMPIDSFFRALAEDQAEFAVAVILSGTGSDGTLGLRAIKEKEGLSLVQEPVTAKFDGMPRSAINEGLADIIAPPENMPSRIAEYFLHAPLFADSGKRLESASQSAMDKLIILLRSQTGNDFSLYKRNTLYRRIERRMGIHKIFTIDLYVRFAQDNPQELDLLFRELLIGVTSFFRDRMAWESLQRRVIAPLVASGSPGLPLRVWSAGCSTGEEAYSLAIAFKEVLESAPASERLSSARSVQIFATDLDRDAIEKARQGYYPANIVADLGPERLDRFFIEEEGGFRVRKEIRDMIIFAPQNLVMDPPFTRLDLVCCRNLLIYLASELQKKVLTLLHYSLNSGGYLFLGSAETIGTFTDLFSPLEGKTQVYKKRETAASNKLFDLAIPPPRLSSIRLERQGAAERDASIQSLADGVLLQRFSPAAVLVNNKGDIIYINGRTGRYLEPVAGKADWNILAMARKGLRLELSDAFHKALRGFEPVRVQGIGVESDGGTSFVNLIVQTLSEPESLKGSVMIAFFETQAPALPPAGDSASLKDAEVRALELELKEAKEEQRSLREEMQNSHEELRSANEELQSTNEELQSINEELTTSKEEMQSLNEELQTVNNELQSKVDELMGSTNDMKNLLNSTDIATLFLDDRLCVRRFTTMTASLTRLIAADVGRPVTDIASELLYPTLASDAREVLRTLVPLEKEIPSSDGRWFSVRVMPYRTNENVIDGVVITYSNITRMKELEALLEAAKVRGLPA